ncbi:ATP-dependent Clp protease proteolytic subunit [Salinarimonas ramus]|uniref:ATP-dependent Clp protease proteolytic subunit n=1 Tax=Salinarimonas ramus TaxID=690164 RepID=A0A917QE80_9HYPH|nr:ATP-dependent Clp protease proteolytic subunit [Salinarimonas ramus]GGK46240.1 ATP-dependent Clp protease proteolytic subunit 3 [Salinarimonas ramus]
MNLEFRLDDEDEKEANEKPQEPTRYIEEKLFQKRHVLITGQINDRIAKATTERLLALAAMSDDPINVFISSPGGHVESGDMIHDIIRFIKPEVRIIGSGWVASAGALIFISVPKERRFCLPNTRFLLHQPSGGIGGVTADVQIQAKQIEIMKRRFEILFAEATGQTPERIAEDTRRDFWLGTAEAQEYGILGTVIRTQADLDAIVGS